MNIDQARANKNALLEELRSCGADIRKDGREIKCPFHDDRSPSAGVYEEKGVWRFKCHGCGFNGDVADIIAKRDNRDLGGVLKEMNPERRSEKPAKRYASVEELEKLIGWMEREDSGRVVAAFKYTNPMTHNIDLVVFRVEYPNKKKQFRQGHQTATGFVLKGPLEPWPIYNRTRVAASDTVIVVEGEKCVHALHDVGFVATTSPAGAGKAAKADWSPLAGKTVYLWPDNDPLENGKRTGIDHMREVADLLGQLEPAAVVYWINPDELDLPPKGDAADYLARATEYSAEQKHVMIEGILSTATRVGFTAELREFIQKAATGAFNPVDWPWPMLQGATRALIPGTVTALCGQGGSTKSFWILQALLYWHRAGIKVAVYELEETTMYHMLRAWAQLSADHSLTMIESYAKNLDETLAKVDTHEAVLESFARCMTQHPRETLLTSAALLDWIEKRARAGARVIVIDPVTMVDFGDKQTWVDELRFLLKAKRIMADYGASLIVVTHPKKSGKGVIPSLDDMAGSAAYARFTQTVLWMAADQTKSCGFKTPQGLQYLSFNRLVQILKARNSYGAGLGIGFYFDGNTFLFSEQGIQDEDAAADDAVTAPPQPHEYKDHAR